MLKSDSTPGDLLGRDSKSERVFLIRKFVISSEIKSCSFDLEKIDLNLNV